MNAPCIWNLRQGYLTNIGQAIKVITAKCGTRLALGRNEFHDNRHLHTELLVNEQVVSRKLKELSQDGDGGQPEWAIVFITVPI
jgi:hypothetical protein